MVNLHVSAYLSRENYTYVIFYMDLVLIALKLKVIYQVVEALRYKSEGRRFDSQLCHWNFSVI
jgi:hypothetical protein